MLCLHMLSMSDMPCNKLFNSSSGKYHHAYMDKPLYNSVVGLCMGSITKKELQLYILLCIKFFLTTDNFPV